MAEGLIHPLDSSVAFYIYFKVFILHSVHLSLVMPVLIPRFLVKYRNFHYILAKSKYILLSLFTNLFRVKGKMLNTVISSYI